MNQRPALCCPTPAFNAQHPHPIPTSGASATSANTSLKTLCTPEGDKVFVQFDTSTIAPVALSAIFPGGEKYEGDLTALVDCDSLIEPPEDLVLTGEDCEGNPVEVSAPPGQIVYAVQAPGHVFTVKFCPEDKDFELSCGKDPATDHQIQTAYRSTPSGPEVLWRVDTVTGLAWTGDPATLEGCGGAGLESDPIEMCDSGVEFIRWVVKKNGEPTGVTYDTDLAMQPYTVTDADAVTKGKCVADSEQSVSSALGNAISGLAKGTSFVIHKNECCAIKLITSVGDIIIPKTATAYSTQVFKTPFTIDSVEVVDGTCDLATVTIISNLSV